MMNLNKIKYFLLITLFMPSFVFGAWDLANSTFRDVISEILSVINTLNPILFALAFLLFFWGLSKFILNANKPEEIKNGRSYMLWGILALFILVSFRALIGFVSNELQIGNSTPIIPLLRTTEPTPTTSTTP